MQRKVKKEKIDKLNTNSISPNQLKLKPPLPGTIPECSNLAVKLKEKMSSLVQLQLKHCQSNQNFLIQDNAPHFPNDYENDKNEHTNIYINTKYDIVEKVAKQMQFIVVKENEDWNISWIDGTVNSARAFNLKRNQRVNHFPGMNEISRKDKLQKNLKIMQRYFHSEYDIFPKTWSLPSEKMEVLSYIRDQKNEETFIIKPACSSQGRGIILVKDIKSLSVIGNTICQSYISNPFLIDGYKFDLRVYVLITSCDPFRIYIYEEGLARFATCYYEKPNKENLNNVYMHLTNYSVQRNSDKFDKNEISGTKRRSSTIYEWLNKNGYNAAKIWKNIDDVIIKTMLCANNSIQHHYSATFPDQYRTSACFELLGFDIILDDNLKPYVLEVNHSPSLETETNIDLSIKTQLLIDIFNLINSIPKNVQKISNLERFRSAERLYWARNKFMSSRKASFEFRKILQDIQIDLERNEMNNKNGFRIIYPISNQTEKYHKFFVFNCENHRNNLNKYSSFDESEHRKTLDGQKETFPNVIRDSKDSNKLNKFKMISGSQIKSWNPVLQNSHTHFKDPTILKQINYNPYRSSKYKDLLIMKNSRKLLDSSTKSLKKIISEKKYETSQIDKKANSNLTEMKKKISSSYSGSKNGRSSGQMDLDNNAIKSPKIIKKQRNTKNISLYKANESNLLQNASAGLEWDSSLSSEKIQNVLQVKLKVHNEKSLTSKDYLTGFQTSLESMILIKNQSFSSRDVDSSNNLKVSINHPENKLELNQHFFENVSKFHGTLNPNDSYEENMLPNEFLNQGLSKLTFENLNSFKLSCNPISNSNISDQESRIPGLTDLSIHPAELNNNKNCSAELINHGPDFNREKELSNDYVLKNDVRDSNTLFAAEIEEYPRLLPKTKVENILKDFILPPLQNQHLISEKSKHLYHVAKLNDISKSIHLSEIKRNLKFGNEIIIMKSNQQKNLSSFFRRTHTTLKRKHISGSVTYNLDNNIFPNQDDIKNNVILAEKNLKGERKKENFISQKIIEIDQDLNEIDPLLSKGLKDNSLSVNNKLVYVDEINTQPNEIKLSRKNYLFNSKNENKYKLTVFKENLNNDLFDPKTKLNENIPIVHFSKKRKPFIKEPKACHQRVLTYNLEQQFICDQSTNINVIDFEKPNNEIICNQNNLLNGTLDIKKCNKMNTINVCEINISPSAFSEESVDLNNIHNYSFTMESNQNSSFQFEQEQIFSNTNNLDDSCIVTNQEALYREAMIRNKNTNHLFETKNISKDPFVIKYFKLSMKKIDQYVEMCMGNNSGRTCLSNTPRSEKPVDNLAKWYSISNNQSTGNTKLKIPDITIRNLNNVIHLFPHRKHKNRSFNLENLEEKLIVHQLSHNRIDSSLNNISLSNSLDNHSNFNGLQLYQHLDSIQTNKSLICKYLKNVASKNQKNKESKLSSTNRLCKILSDKTNIKNNRVKLENLHNFDNKLVLQYVNY